jgi:hypothetical protein
MEAGRVAQVASMRPWVPIPVKERNYEENLSKNDTIPYSSLLVSPE